MVLKRTQISAGKTLTCKMAGTAKLLSARTKVRIGGLGHWRLCDAAASSQRTRAVFSSQGSISSWLVWRRRHAAVTNKNVMGHMRRTRTQMAPWRE